MKKALFPVALLALLLTMIVSACGGGSTPTTTTSAPPPTSSTSAPPTTTTKPPTATTTAPSGQAPKYGGILNWYAAADVSTFDDQNQGGPGNIPGTIISQTLWTGDWTKGIAGGYGTKSTDWGTNGYDAFDQKTGDMAQSWKVNVNNDQGTAQLIYTIRQGMHYGLDPNNSLSKQVNGREVTVADILEAINHGISNPVDYVYRSNPELRTLDVKQTGPWEITINMPVSSLVTCMSRIGSTQRMYAPEMRGKGTDWHAMIGAGPFMLTNYVSGSSFTYAKNPNFWMTDPIGPGKGNKLPYIDGINVSIITDTSTRIAAFRTGKIDEINALSWEDSAQLKKEFPNMPYADIGDWYSPGGSCIYMRTDKAPYSDIRVRQALMLATDFNSIKQNFNGGSGIIQTFPFVPYPGYETLYAGLDDPDLPQSTKDLYTYNPTKAKQLLSDAGFPNGFHTNVLTIQTASDYMQLLAGMWAKAGITLDIKVMDLPSLTNTLNAQALTDLTYSTGFPPSTQYYTGNVINGVPGAATNLSYVNDQQVIQWLPQIRTLAATDPAKAMALAKQMDIYAVGQVWALPIPKYRTTTFWQPWLKNYSGEISVGYYNIANWLQYVWIDPSLKK